MNKRVLVACEYSGTVRDAFSNLGWDAWSCDLLPTESDQTKRENKHIMADVRLLIPGNWDLMICHPPCTYLTVAGNRHIPGNPERWKKQYEAMIFAWGLFNADIPHIAMENPVGVLSTYIGKPIQIIQPYEYGHPESKKTCLWLKNLPKLESTNILQLPKCGHWYNRTGRILNLLEEVGIVSERKGVYPRDVLVTDMQKLNTIFEKLEMCEQKDL